MTRIISSIILVIGLALVFSLPQHAQLPANTCYFGVTGMGTGAAQSIVCTDQSKFPSALTGQSCLPASGFALMAQLPNGNCLPVQVYAPTGTVASNRLLLPEYVWWNQEGLGNKTCAAYWTPGLPCITLAHNRASGGFDQQAIGVPVQTGPAQ